MRGQAVSIWGSHFWSEFNSNFLRKNENRKSIPKFSIVSRVVQSQIPRKIAPEKGKSRRRVFKKNEGSKNADAPIFEGVLYMSAFYATAFCHLFASVVAHILLPLMACWISPAHPARRLIFVNLFLFQGFVLFFGSCFAIYFAMNFRCGCQVCLEVCSPVVL